MANHILGVDLGAYSVKVVVANPGFRGATVVDFIERLVPPGDDPAPVRAARVFGEIVRERQFGSDPVYAAVPGDQLFIHILEFSFANLKRTELEKVVGAELEDILPLDLEDLVYTFDAIPSDVAKVEGGPVADLGAPMSDDDPTFVQAQASGVVHGRVAPPTAGMRVLTCAMPRTGARELLDRLEAHTTDMRSIIAAPASYMRVAERIGALSDAKAEAVAIIDIGHERTDVCVVRDGRAVFARTIPRGGRHVTDAIARTWRLPFDQAESAKHSDGFIASAAQPASSDNWARIHEVLITEVGPMARDIKQTLSACRAKTGAVITRVELVGGGSRLRGLAGFMSDKLRIPCMTLDPADSEAILGQRLAHSGVHADVACLAAGVAFEGSTGRPMFDLRQGDLAFKTDTSYLRSRMPVLAASLLIVIAFAAFNAYARLNSLRKSEKVLNGRLAVETTALFGKALSLDETTKRLKKDDPKSGESPLPKMTSYDILLDINERLPEAKDLKIDITELDIKPGRVSIKAITGTTEKYDAVQASAEVVKALKGQPCFTDVQRGNISSGPDDTKNFPITIKSECR
ncbi:MAG TPA: pilus assembly protein PilM [Kofleriaceae bacterium]|nr:pilus assembly protein PilM [Kofleriaceae bacterium]